MTKTALKRLKKSEFFSELRMTVQAWDYYLKTKDYKTADQMALEWKMAKLALRHITGNDYNMESWNGIFRVINSKDRNDVLFQGNSAYKQGVLKMIYKGIVLTKTFDEPMQYFGGIHHNCLSYVHEIRIELVRYSDGFYLTAGAYYLNYGDLTVYFSLDDFNVKVASYHRMANSTIKRLSVNREILSIAGLLVKKTIDRIAEYKEAGNDNY
jgi:hypothetical protein